jgi:hypothetical protein
LIRTYKPAVVVHTSPSTGDVGAVPCGTFSEARDVVLAGTLTGPPKTIDPDVIGTVIAAVGEASSPP